jgi:hypothetical protein
MILPALLALGLAGCATGSAKVTPVPQYVVLPDGGVDLPVRWFDDLPLLEIHVDGRGPYTFVLDTGAATNVVSRRVADARFDAVVRAPTSATDAAGRDVDLEMALRIGSLRAGDLVLRELAASVADLESLHPYLRFRLDGILGYPAFENLLLMVDYPNRRVRVARGSLPPVDERTILDDLGTGTPDVAVVMPDGILPVLVDTGSRSCIAAHALPQEVRLDGNPVAGDRSVTLAGPADREVMARLADPVRLGEHEVRGAEVTLSPGRAQLGSRFLRHFRVTFDPRGRKVRFERTGGPVSVSPLVGIGARFRDDGDGWRIWDVVPHGPAAEAGLTVGNRVLSVQGLACESGNDDAIRALFRRAGTTVALEVVRGEGTETLSVDVRSLIP